MLKLKVEVYHSKFYKNTNGTLLKRFRCSYIDAIKAHISIVKII